MSTVPHRAEFTGTADLHLHTRHSDGEPTVPELLDHVARRTTLDVIAICDHDTIAGALEARHAARASGWPFEVIIGEEISTRHGHLVGLFLCERIRPGLSAADTVAAIKEQGGLAFAPHPFFRCKQVRDDAVTMVGLGELAGSLDLDAIETINSTPFLQAANRRASAFNATRRLPELGCSDGHILAAVGKGYTRFKGRTALELFDAIVTGQTMACSRPYRTLDLLDYLRFWLKMTGGDVPSYLRLDRSTRPSGAEAGPTAAGAGRD
ncbi:MAG TPA: PHP-associated domain-containing protein [Chloroflexota bacterium]|nr:PHP-associated domain-containing protein [Chloroflexota bacterium]